MNNSLPSKSEIADFLNNTRNERVVSLNKIEGSDNSISNQSIPERKLDASAIQEEPEYRIVSARYLLENKIIETPMLWGHLLQTTGIAVLSGSSDTGKSTLLRQLSIAIITRQENFLGLNLNSKHYRVIYISTEDDEYSLSPRIKKEHKKESAADFYDNLTFILDGEDTFEAAKKEFEKNPADCIIIDTWGDYADGDLNAANNVRTPLKALRSFALTHKCLFIINHHNRKSASDTDISKRSLLGSQSLEAKARVVLMLTIDNIDPTLRKLSISKGNYIPYGLKKKSIVLRTTEDFIFEYLKEVENHTQGDAKEDGRYYANEDAVKLLLGQGKKPLEIIAQIPSMVENPYRKSAIRKIINKLSTPVQTKVKSTSIAL
jgi:hypothetical protein